MATAIKAIPTLYGEDAIRFKKKADETERCYKDSPKIDWGNNPKVLEVRKIWAEMICSHSLQAMTLYTSPRISHQEKNKSK